MKFPLRNRRYADLLVRLFDLQGSAQAEAMTLGPVSPSIDLEPAGSWELDLLRGERRFGVKDSRQSAAGQFVEFALENPLSSGQLVRGEFIGYHQQTVQPEFISWRLVFGQDFTGWSAPIRGKPLDARLRTGAGFVLAAAGVRNRSTAAATAGSEFAFRSIANAAQLGIDLELAPEQCRFVLEPGSSLIVVHSALNSICKTALVWVERTIEPVERQPT